MSSYIIGQYNHNSSSKDDDSFISLIKNGVADRFIYKGYGDSSGDGGGTISFEDECLTNLTLQKETKYYFRCQIKRILSDQVFTIKLLNKNPVSTAQEVEQFLKEITIKGGDYRNGEWINIDFIFQPIINFDTIFFQLERTSYDYRTRIRYPKIAYQELGEIKNIIDDKIKYQTRLLKIGVQSHPGLTLCVNGEEIHVSRSGIFEVRNGIIPVTFFSAVTAAKENTTELEDWITNINTEVTTFEEDETLSNIEKQNIDKSILSRAFLGTSKTIKIDPFILDYMYEG